MEKAWWKESVVYQIYPRSFCDSNADGIGDLNGIRSRLDYLRELGINVVWMSPIYQSPNDDNGYDISDYRAIMTEFGTMEDFKALLAEAHERGIRIMMDLVVNHTSDEHPWFVESRKSMDNPYRDYYIWREPKDGKEPNNWGSCFSGPAWKWDESTGMYYLHLFSTKQPDLNWENPRVREEVWDMMNWWVDMGIDGFRMDVISLISKPEGLPDDVPELNGYASFNTAANGPHVHEYIQEMRRKVLNRADLITVGECSGVTLEEAKKYANAQGTELNMVFQFEHMGVDSAKGTKWTDKRIYLPDLKEVLSRWQYGLEGIAWNSLFFCNHDQPRIVSRLGDNSPASAKCIATLLHFMQGTPYVYQGEELGMTNVPFGGIEDFRDLDSINAYHELIGQGVFDEETMLHYLRRKSRDNARSPMQWDDTENAGFTTGMPWIMVNPNYSAINAKAQLADENSVFHYYRRLIGLRRESDWSEVIVYGSYALLAPEDEHIYAYTRTLGERRLLVVCNVSAQPQTFAVPEELAGENAQVVIGNLAAPVWGETLTLEPWQACVWEV